MFVLALYLYSLQLMPVRTPRDMENRWFLAETIAAEEPDPDYARAEILIAGYESGYADDVKACKRKGDGGRGHGLFQIHPINRGDDRRACGSIPEQVRIAGEYVRRSAAACPGFAGADQLAVYVSGKCQRGIPHARRRWEGPSVAEIFGHGTPKAPEPGGSGATGEVEALLGDER